MLNPRDIKALVGPSRRQYLLLIWASILIIVFFAFGVIYNLYLAIHYASLDGFNLGETLSLWNEETILEKFYSGFNVESKHRLNMSILDFGVAAITGLNLWLFFSNNRRKRRIVSELIECGALTEEQLDV